MASGVKRATARLLARLGHHATRSVHRRLDRQERDLDRLRILLGQLHAARVRSLEPGAPLREAEFRVFSQWGQDGILEHLLTHVPVETDTFVEFGVQDYRESNTRFLLQHRNWRGLVMDGSEANVAAIRDADLYWRYDLQAVHAFITAENINDLIREAGIGGDIGVLSIDIDGMDYWVWESMDVVDPRVVVCEYNSLFGADAAVTVPYEPGFRRAEAHWSHLYFGASLPALTELAESKGYRFLGCTSAGNDAFFVREDCLSGLRPVTVEEGFVAGRARESRDEAGRLTYLDRASARDVIGGMELEDVRTGSRLTVRDLDGR
jgi:hypothetical protein